MTAAAGAPSPEAADLVTGGRSVLWVGRDAPVPGCVTAEELLDPGRDYRLPAEYHGQFDTVFLVEVDVSDASHWVLVVDEALRALRPKGTLVVRYRVGSAIATPVLMELLSRRTAGRATPVFVRQWPGSPERVVAVEVIQDPRPAAFDGVTFGLVTDGRQPGRVRDFVESVRALRGLRQVPYEILVCGPAGSVDHVASPAFADVRLVEQSPEHTDRGWITRKKNQIVAAAAHPYVLVVHDRYLLEPDWLEEVRRFGPDFDVVVPAQRTSDGMRYPDWVAVADDTSLSPLVELPYGSYAPEVFVNGGAILARTAVLRETGWNELLFWADAEDVELTRRLQSRGIVPRLAHRVRLTSSLTRADQVSVFERRPTGPCRRVSMAPAPAIPLGVPRRASVDGSSGVLYEASSVDRAGRPRAYRHELALKVPPDVADLGVVLLHVTVPSGVDLAALALVTVNGVPVPVSSVSGGRDGRTASYRLEDVGVLPAHTLRVGWTSPDPVDFTEATVTLAPAPGRGEAATELGLGAGGDLRGSGWNDPEAWGTWSAGARSSLVVRVADPRRRPRLRLQARGYLPGGLSRQLVVVSLGSAVLAELGLGEDAQWHTIPVPRAAAATGVLQLTFDVLLPGSPSAQPGNRDTRQLGIGVERLAAQDLTLLRWPPAGGS